MSKEIKMFNPAKGTVNMVVTAVASLILVPKIIDSATKIYLSREETKRTEIKAKNGDLSQNDSDDKKKSKSFFERMRSGSKE